ncbi:hypothetical protein SK128_018590 [Halocaridina rubra]|uniref:Uncharacterized protein n=1 Tax=Halocaridina rubra TaxID=373956 RepID=A0AAN9A0M9_HALRR
MSRWRKDPLEVCGGQHTNGTLAYHECLCRFDYRNQRSSQALKFKHCLLADEMRRIDNFELYVIIAVVVGVILIFGMAAFCSCKWYLHTKSNPFGCFSCCKKTRKKKKEEVTIDRETIQQVDECDSKGQVWTPMRLVVSKGAEDGNPIPNHEEELPKENPDQRSSTGFCMKFCLSDPVQDCCEFFDCDIMWRKKNIYTIPIFSRRKQAPLQRRPTRPAPPPPKPVITPVIKYAEPVMEGFEDGMECEPVPEAPPSPEPVRTDQPRAMYVDPLSFLQKPFLKTSKDKASEDEPDALYSKVKEFVFGKSKKSASVASLNKLPSTKSDAMTTASGKKCKYGRTGSLASLHNLSEEQLDSRYNSKRSLSLASLHMVEEEPSGVVPKGTGSKLLARSKGSLHNICEDEDSHISLKADEYIDLEEMSKRLEAKMLAAQGTSVDAVPKPVAHITRQPEAINTRVRSNWTPNFIPASAYSKPSKIEELKTVSPKMTGTVVTTDIAPCFVQTQACLSPDAQYGSHYFPPVPATPEKPAIPARMAVGLPVVNSGTLNRPKPALPPRPPGSGGSSPRPRCGASQKPRAPQPPSMMAALTPKHPQVIKPTSPPPPPPITVPIESSL